MDTADPAGMPAASLATPDSAQLNSPKPKRQTCPRCSRPLRVCLCGALPERPFQLHGHLVVLQHPLESKQAFATVPLLRHVMQPCKITVGRELQPFKDAELQQILNLTRPTSTASSHPDAVSQAAHSAQSSAQVPLYILYPTAGAVPVDEVANSQQHLQRLQSAADSMMHQHSDADHADSITAEYSASPVKPAEEYQQGCVLSMQLQGEQQLVQPALQPQQQMQLHQPVLSLHVPECFTPQQASLKAAVPHLDAHQTVMPQPDIGQPAMPQLAVQKPSIPTSNTWQPVLQQQSTPGQQQALTRHHSHANSSSAPAYVLLVVDGTWKQSKEMFNKLKTEWLPPNGPAITITLPFHTSHSTPGPLSNTTQQAVQSEQCAVTLPHADSQPQLDAFKQPAGAKDPLQPEPSRATTVPAEQSVATLKPARTEANKPHVIHNSEPSSLSDRRTEVSAAVSVANVVTAADQGMNKSSLTPCSASEVRNEQSAAMSMADEAGTGMDKSCLIRKEPVEGFMTTYEAVARAVAVLEGSYAHDGFLDAVLAPLKLWTAKQAEFDPCTRDRISGKREEHSDWAVTHARMKKQPKKPQSSRGKVQAAHNASTMASIS